MRTPTDYTFQGLPTPDSAKYVRLDSTQTCKIDLTVSRKASTFNQSTKQFSVPEYRIVFRSDVTNAEDMPTGQRITADLALRYPVGTDQTRLKEFVTSLETLMSDPDFMSSIAQQTFPQKAAS